MFTLEFGCYLHRLLFDKRLGAEYAAQPGLYSLVLRLWWVEIVLTAIVNEWNR